MKYPVEAVATPKGSNDMQYMKTAFIVCAALCALSCSGVTVGYDYDTGVDFSGFKSYAWQEIARTIEMNDLVVKRVQAAVNRELQTKGFRLSPDRPDFCITMHVRTRQRVAVTDWGGPYRWWGYGGIDAREYEEGVLIIDFLDARNDELVWRGIATGVVDPDLDPVRRTAEINNAVARILEKFPPRPSP